LFILSSFFAIVSSPSSTADRNVTARLSHESQKSKVEGRKSKAINCVSSLPNAFVKLNSFQLLTIEMPNQVRHDKFWALSINYVSNLPQIVFCSAEPHLYFPRKWESKKKLYQSFKYNKQKAIEIDGL
jgi:hypothetical protein